MTTALALARRGVTSVAGLAVLVAVWELLGARGSLPTSVASPSEILDELTERSDTLWFHTGPTLSAAVWGFVWATVASFVVAVVIVFVPRSASSLYNTAVVVSSVPLIALTPVLVLWIERGSAVRITIAAIAGFFPILVGCIQGLGRVDERTDELFHQLAASRTQRFLRLSLPRSLPFVFAGLKAAAAASVLGAVIAEWTGGGGTRGLGQMMTNALFGFNVPLTWLTILTTAALSIVAYAVIALLERVVVRWEADAAEVAL